MTKSWPLLVLAVFGAVVAAFCLAAFDWTAWACRLPAAEEGKVLTPGFGGCVEFWLNRYQTLIGALVAIGAAALAYRGVKMQIVSAEKQVKVGRRQSSIALLEIMNERSGDVRSMQREVMAAYSRLRGADGAMRRAIISIERMAELVADPAALRDEYVNQFERCMKSHNTMTTAAEVSIAQAIAFLGKALISTATKSEIEDFILLTRHSHATHVMAQQVFTEIIRVFDENRENTRAIVIQDKLAEIKSIVNIPISNRHEGYAAAISAAQHMAEIIDLALQDAEGRND